MEVINGAMLIGYRELASATLTQAINPASGAALGPGFGVAGADEVALACALAAGASIPFGDMDHAARAQFLYAIGEHILRIGDLLIERAMAETGLPRARLEGERSRTISQLGMFADVLRRGGFVDAVVDPALPDRKPLPRPDLRRMNIPVGPVAVFGASNFPLAFSVAGGDTASALAAGCPVIVKGHPAHPGTGELVARAVLDAARETGMPEGVFSFLPGGVETGTLLASDPRIKAIGFTGSRAGGLALMQTAARRREPIPVFAEMSAINPVFLLPAALEQRGAELGSAFVQSLTMGAGQFCTSPGLILAIDGPGLDKFLDAAVEAMTGSPGQTMLTPDIHAAYLDGVESLDCHIKVECLGRGMDEDGPNQARVALFRADAATFLNHHELASEVFGAASLVIVARDADELLQLVTALEGQLTSTLQMEPGDERLAATLLPYLQRKVGRILVNGWPTGVEVCSAMVHGGPFPATSDGRTTSVGTLAINRFLRPVCFQNFPKTLLPKDLAALGD